MWHGKASEEDGRCGTEGKEEITEHKRGLMTMFWFTCLLWSLWRHTVGFPYSLW